MTPVRTAKSANVAWHPATPLKTPHGTLLESPWARSTRGSLLNAGPCQQSFLVLDCSGFSQDDAVAPELAARAHLEALAQMKPVQATATVWGVPPRASPSAAGRLCSTTCRCLFLSFLPSQFPWEESLCCLGAGVGFLSSYWQEHSREINWKHFVYDCLPQGAGEKSSRVGREVSGGCWSPALRLWMGCQLPAGT